MNVGPGILVLLIGLLAVSAVVTGIIYLFIKGGTFIRLFLGILFILVLLAVPTLLLFSYPVRVPVETSAVITSADSAVHLQAPDLMAGSSFHIAKDPTLWQGNLEQELTPEVYSSSLTAAYGLGMQLHETFSTASETMPKRVSIIERPEITDPILLEQLRQGLMRSLSDTQIVIMEPAPNTGPSEEDFWISLSMQNDPTHELAVPSVSTGNTATLEQFINFGNQTGSLQAAVETPKGKFFKQVSYDYRPWLFDTEKFRSASGYGQWAVMTSSEAATTQEQAQSQVMESAVHYLNEQLAVHHIATAGAVQSDLRERGFIVDEYSQELKGLSGPIWRAAVLLDVSPERLESLRTHVVLQEHQVRRSWVKLFVSIGGMIFVIVIVYTIMNALTKGYYSGRFAILAVILILLFSVFLLFIHRSSSPPLGLF